METELLLDDIGSDLFQLFLYFKEIYTQGGDLSLIVNQIVEELYSGWTVQLPAPLIAPSLQQIEEVLNRIRKELLRFALLPSHSSINFHLCHAQFLMMNV